MPKRKHHHKPAPTTVEERRQRNERVVHREEPHITLGEVLEQDHVDDAIGLLSLRDDLDGKKHADEKTVVPPLRIVPSKERSNEPTMPPSPSASPELLNDKSDQEPKVSRDPQEKHSPKPRRRNPLSGLSPLRLLRSLRTAASELRAGFKDARVNLKKARADLRAAVRRAIQAF